MIISPKVPHREPLPYMACSDPEPGTDHSQCMPYLGWTQHWGIQGSLLLSTFRRYVFSFTIDKHVCKKDLSAKGTRCIHILPKIGVRALSYPIYFPLPLCVTLKDREYPAVIFDWYAPPPLPPPIKYELERKKTL